MKTQFKELFSNDPIVPVSAAIGALKGAAVGVVVGKLGAAIVVGAIGGALIGTGIAAIRRAQAQTPVQPEALAYEQYGC